MIIFMPYMPYVKKEDAEKVVASRYYFTPICIIMLLSLLGLAGFYITEVQYPNLFFWNYYFVLVATLGIGYSIYYASAKPGLAEVKEKIKRYSNGEMIKISDLSGTDKKQVIIVFLVILSMLIYLGGLFSPIFIH